MTDESLRELQRARWRRYREVQRLVDPAAEDFARGGLGRGVSELSVRLLVLPGDPERDRIDFNPRLWAWLKSELESPFPGSATDWGRHFTPTTAAAVRGLRASQDKWDSYFAIHRNGGLEMALGPDGGGYVNERRAFWLLRIVGRIWAAIHGYGEAVRQFGVEGPFECTGSTARVRSRSLDRGLVRVVASSVPRSKRESLGPVRLATAPGLCSGPRR